MLRLRNSAQKMRIQAHWGTVSVQYMTTRDMALYSLARTYEIELSDSDIIVMV
jgi:hypothetical protein